MKGVNFINIVILIWTIVMLIIIGCLMKEWTRDVEKERNKIMNKGWTRIYEDDKRTFPPENKAVLLSFSNCEIPLVGFLINGTFKTSPGGKSYTSMNLFVNGWMELPKRLED